MMVVAQVRFFTCEKQIQVIFSDDVDLLAGHVALSSGEGARYPIIIYLAAFRVLSCQSRTYDAKTIECVSREA